jgi:hypothetical protein
MMRNCRLETVLGLAVDYEAVLACDCEENDAIEKNIQLAKKTLE